uniref:Uncharacterized protein n=1 Tax=Romanomermis culicivorax TaxID=13658 RepID=A0A915J7K0_ROMCU
MLKWPKKLIKPQKYIHHKAFALNNNIEIRIATFIQSKELLVFIAYLITCRMPANESNRCLTAEELCYDTWKCQRNYLSMHGI